MKKSILLSLTFFSLAACQKEAKTLPKIIRLTSTAIVAAKPDTIPDTAVLKIKLCKDNVNTDETALVFNHKASINYLFNEDAPYFVGFGQVSLASISVDGRDLAINDLPYTSGMSIGLDVHTKTDGAYVLKLSYENKIPADVQIMLRDTYLKDSVDVRTKNYNFNVSKADTNSFGSKRFRLILGGKAQQTASSH